MSRSHGVAGAWYTFFTRAPSRVFDFSLNDGWKKLMYSRELAYNWASAFVASAPLRRP